MKAPRSRAAGVSGYKNDVNYIPQLRYAGFPLRYNKLRELDPKKKCLCLSMWVCG